MRLKQFTFLFLALPFSVFASSLTNENTINFDVSVEKDIAHDLLQVTLFTQVENKDLTLVNKEVNSKINQALEVLKNYPDVELRDNSRSTSVRYGKDGKQNGWVTRGQLLLESKNSESLSKVMNALEGILAIEYASSRISSSAIKSIEDEMIQQALKQVEHKAKLFQQSFGVKDYKIVELNVRTPMESGPTVFRAYAAQEKSFSSVYDEIPLTNGKANVKVSIDARIQLIQE